MLTFSQTMAKLKKSGTAQNRKIYANHGAPAPQFGVSFKELGLIQKQIKIDHNLAIKLWESGNTDARVLALLVADPEKFSFKQAEIWLKEITFYLHSNFLGTLVAKTNFAFKAYKKWSRSKKEIHQHCGYDVLATLIKNGYSLSKEEIELIVDEIEKNIHQATNRGKSAMNAAIICIGTYHPGMKTKTVAAAKRIGLVQVDHGITNCKTPDAASYIEKAYKHRMQKNRKK